MRCCTSTTDLLARAIGTVCLWLCASSATAEGITVSKAEVRLTDEGYHLSVNYEIELPRPVLDALQRGVTLHFVSEFAVRRSRWYWLDTDIAQEELAARLSFNALTQQYRLSRGSLFQSFYELSDALRVLGRQTVSPIPLQLLDKDAGGYFSRMLKKGSDCCTAYASMRLEVAHLPKPLQVNALTNVDWQLESEPYRWEIPAFPQREAAP